MKTPALSPKWLLLWALRLAALPLALHLCGARAQVGVLAGSLAHPAAMALGAAYALSYFVAVLLGPPLVLAAVVVASVQGLGGRQG